MAVATIVRRKGDRRAGRGGGTESSRRSRGRRGRRGRTERHKGNGSLGFKRGPNLRLGLGLRAGRLGDKSHRLQEGLDNSSGTRLREGRRGNSGGLGPHEVLLRRPRPRLHRGPN
jgi:hypothetical protein